MSDSSPTAPRPMTAAPGFNQAEFDGVRQYLCELYDYCKALAHHSPIGHLPHEPNEFIRRYMVSAETPDAGKSLSALRAAGEGERGNRIERAALYVMQSLWFLSDPVSRDLSQRLEDAIYWKAASPSPAPKPEDL